MAKIGKAPRKIPPAGKTAQGGLVISKFLVTDRNSESHAVGKIRVAAPDNIEAAVEALLRTPRADPLTDARTFFHLLANKYGLDGRAVRSLLISLLSDYKNTTEAGEAKSALPQNAPELWGDRDLNHRENPPQFVRRVYAQWLGHGLARKHLASLDPALYKALGVWLTRHKDDDITSVLPPQSDILDELIDRLRAEYPLEDLRKLGYAIDARLRRRSTK